MELRDEEPTFERRERPLALWLAALFGLVAVLAAVDLAADLVEGTTLRHALIEGGVVLVGLFGVGLIGRRVAAATRRERALRTELAGVTDSLESTRAESERWRSAAGDLLRGLGATIDEQLTRWRLTPAEKEVALLLLKGLSSREIAEVRQVAEPTVRQQSRAVYRKAGLAGRRELAAFFLEDLLLPPHTPQ